MRFDMITGVIVIVLLLTAPISALNAKVYGLCEGNLSLGLGEDFNIAKKTVDNSNNGTFNQNFEISSSKIKGLAVLQIMDIYDEVLQGVDPASISSMWIEGAMSGALKEGGKPIGNWSATSSKGEDTTVHEVDLANTTMSIIGKRVQFASWNIGRNKYAGVISFFDENVTRQMVASLALS